MLSVVLLAGLFPSDPSPFEVDGLRRGGARFVHRDHRPEVAEIGDEILHSGWLLVDVRHSLDGHTAVLVVRESDGKMAEMWYNLPVRDIPVLPTKNS